MMDLTFKSLPDQPLNILCLGAHCDDIEIGCGGTLLDLLATHPTANCTWAVFSNNKVRAAETNNAVRAMFGENNRIEIVTFDHQDGFMPYKGTAVKEDFERLKGQLNPDVIFTHHRHDLHQDHRTVCDLTWNTFRNHLIFEYEIPKYDGDLGRPNTYRPITAEIAEKKVGALLASYASQADKPWFDRDLFLAIMRLRGMECNAPSGLAEAFYAPKVRLSF
jgi:LmbE family N-acetylglucosaminyl deacetylase